MKAKVIKPVVIECLEGSVVEISRRQFELARLYLAVEQAREEKVKEEEKEVKAKKKQEK